MNENTVVLSLEEYKKLQYNSNLLAAIEQDRDNVFYLHVPDRGDRYCSYESRLVVYTKDEVIKELHKQLWEQSRNYDSERDRANKYWEELRALKAPITQSVTEKLKPKPWYKRLFN